jgi:hypothetical protein
MENDDKRQLYFSFDKDSLISLVRFAASDLLDMSQFIPDRYENRDKWPFDEFIPYIHKESFDYIYEKLYLEEELPIPYDFWRFLFRYLLFKEIKTSLDYYKNLEIYARLPGKKEETKVDTTHCLLNNVYMSKQDFLDNLDDFSLCSSFEIARNFAELFQFSFTVEDILFIEKHEYVNFKEFFKYFSPSGRSSTLICSTKMPDDFVKRNIDNYMGAFKEQLYDLTKYVGEGNNLNIFKSNKEFKFFICNLDADRLVSNIKYSFYGKKREEFDDFFVYYFNVLKKDPNKYIKALNIVDRDYKGVNKLREYNEKKFNKQKNLDYRSYLYDLPEDVILKNKRTLRWYFIIKSQKLSEEFLINHISPSDFDIVYRENRRIPQGVKDRVKAMLELINQ